MKYVKLFAIALVCFYLSGCAKPTPQIDMAQDFYSQSGKKVGVALVEQQEAEFLPYGSIGLLDYAIIGAATAELNKHIKSLDISEFSTIKAEIARDLENSGFDVAMIEDLPAIETMGDFSDPNKDDETYFFAKDMTSLKAKYGVDYLLLLQTYRVGADRSYNGFIPLGDPRATFGTQANLIDLSDNHLMLNKTTFLFRNSEGEWDEPPSFPGLTNSFYITMEQVREQVMQNMKVTAAAAQTQQTVPAKKAE